MPRRKDAEMPEIVELAERPYVGLRGKVAMAGIPAFADRLGEVVSWLVAHDTELQFKLKD